MIATTITSYPSFAQSSPRLMRTALNRRPWRSQSTQAAGDDHAQSRAEKARRFGTAGKGGCATEPVSPPGVIGAAVLRLARQAAGISKKGFARRLTVSATAVRNWENGTTPLYLVECDVLRRIADILGTTDGGVSVGVRELVIASQCDLLIAGMLDGSEDYAEVPPVEDDTADGQTARGLLRWALTGAAPSLLPTNPANRGIGRGTPLLGDSDVARISAIARSLGDSQDGDGLASFGQALQRLTRS